MTQVAFNPNDPLQQGFLASIAQGESGNNGSAWFTGYGGSNLSGNSQDSFGFPQWTGLGNTHAAGTFQFQPSTWDSVAQTYNLNFNNPSDQAAGAWYLAQQKDPNLYDQLQSGDYGSIASSLKGTWTSITSGGISNAIQSGASVLGLGGSNSSGDASGSGGTGDASSSAGPVSTIENLFQRGGLIIIGALIILVALWVMLSHSGAVPSPGDTAKALAAA